MEDQPVAASSGGAPATAPVAPSSVATVPEASSPGKEDDGKSKHPSERYSKSQPGVEGVSKLCSKLLFSAFDNEKCTEVVWIEYREVPRYVMDRSEELVGALIALDHPNLVKYHAGWADRKNRTLVFITEQVTGDLRNWLVKKIEMASKVYVRWIRQLCQGLDYLHKNNFLHADLNTSKIYVRGSGELKIGGLAEFFFADVSFSDKDFHVGVGAPELIHGAKLSPMQNVYQLGLCALQVFTRQHPYRGMNLSQIVKAQVENVLPPELGLLKEKDPVAFDLVSRCLTNVESRITLAGLLRHPFLLEEGMIKSPDMTREPEVVVPFKPAFLLGHQSSGALVLVPPVSAAAPGRGRCMKCYFGGKTAEALCVRIWMDTVRTLDDLRKMIETDFREQQSLFADNLSLRYRDSENDLVVITSRTTIEEVLEFAVHLELHPKASGSKQSSSLLGDLLRN